MADPDPVDEALRQLRHPNPHLSALASLRLKHLVPQALERISAGLADESGAVRLKTVLVLADSGDPVVAAPLLDYWRRIPFIEERWRVAPVLEELQDQELAPLLLAFYQERFRNGFSYDRREAVRGFDHHQEVAAPLIQEALRDKDEEVRSVARYITASYHSRPEPAVGRANRARYRWRLAFDEGIEPLDRDLARLGMPLDQKDIKRLDEAERERVLERLLAELERTGPRSTGATLGYRLALIRGLGRLGSASALPALVEVMHTDVTELDAWGAGVGVSAAEAVEDAINYLELALHRRGEILPGLDALTSPTSPNPPPPAGPALVPLLGLPREHQRVREAIALLGPPSPSAGYANYANKQFLGFRERGVLFTFVGQALKEIKLFVLPTDDYGAWPYALPRDLHPELSRFALRRRFLVTSKSSREADYGGYFDRWIFWDHALRVDYPPSQDHISAVTLSAPDGWPA